MKTLLFIFLTILLTATHGWLTDFEAAKKEAKGSGKYLLLNFSGSDWCAPCIKTKKDVFDKDAFKDYASKNLILVNIDFPRQKKNKLSETQVSHNNALAEKYNSKGMLPYTILLDAEGNIIKEWPGMLQSPAEDFVNQLKNLNVQHAK